jgi:hypothetical protein
MGMNNHGVSFCDRIICRDKKGWLLGKKPIPSVYSKLKSSIE